MQYIKIKFLAIFLFLGGFSLAGFSQAAFEPDLSMSLESFEKEALTEKEEVWVVDFWASWCRPCIMSIPHLKEVKAQYEDKNVRFISVSWDENERFWMTAVTRLTMDWNQILVPDVRAEHPFLDANFPHKSIPSVFVISKAGKVKKVNDIYKLDKAIEKAL